MITSAKKVLIIGPHPDDGEFSSGGTIVKLIDQGAEIYYAVFSDCEKSVPEGFAPNAIIEEWKESSAVLGIKRENLIFKNFPVREFPKHRQDILETLVQMNKDINPDLVFIPSASDIHQDHKTINEEATRAFKYKNLLGYEMPWNNFSFNSSMYVTLTKDHIEKKIEAIAKYKSQDFRSYSGKEFVESLAKMRGIQVKAEFAESFEIIRWIS